MEFYENGGGATARLLVEQRRRSPKAVVPASRLYPAARGATPIRINFQPSGAPVPAGYLADTGLDFANRGNGQTLRLERRQHARRRAIATRRTRPTSATTR